MARLLVADDARVVRETIREIVASEGYKIVSEASNGVEVVDAFERFHPDVLLMDLVMPRRSGIGALEEILARHPTACVVVCGALGQDALVAEALRVGARSFVLKPLHPERTLAALRQVTEKGRQASSPPEAAF